MRRLPGIKRALRDLSRRARGLRSGPERSSGPSPARLDSWLELFDSELGPIDAACAGGSPESFALFRDLDDDLWALLLTRAYEVYPNIRSLLPSMPDPGLQELWNGTSGVTLASQGNAFYRKLRDRHRAHSDRALSESSVLDFGCGWGRLTRFLVRDVEPGRLYGCDPVEQILQVCRDSRVPATLARSSFVPERLPFDAEFDLAFSFSVFTHLSEAAHESCLRALHASLRPGGLLVVTVRPPEYLRFSPLMRPALEALGPDPETRLREPRYIFVPHPAEPTHLQYDDGEMTYGETVVTLPYVRERWTPLFNQLAVDLLVADPYQLVLTLRRR